MRYTLLFFILISCAKKETKLKTFGPLVTSIDPPRKYELADPSCQLKSEGLRNIAKANFSQLENFQLVEKELLFHETSSTEYLHSNAIRQVFWGLQYERICGFSKEENIDCNKHQNYQLNSQFGGRLKICQTENIQQGSVEAASLQSLHTINQVHQMIQDDLKSLSLPAIDLMILPTFKTKVYGKTSPADYRNLEMHYFITNNAAYFGDTIMIFPDSETYDKKEAKLWESPFVLAHEYGHHVHQTIFLSKDNDKKNDLKNSFSWNPWQHRYEIKMNSDTDRPLQASKNEAVLSAISEGLADLISFYSLEENLSSLKGLYCFSHNRDVSINNFKNGDLKIISPEILNLLSPSQSFAQEDDCENYINYSDPHTLGASIANIFQLLIQKIPLPKENLSKKEIALFRLNILITWIKDFRDQVLYKFDFERDTSLEFMKMTLNIWDTKKMKLSSQVSKEWDKIYSERVFLNSK